MLKKDRIAIAKIISDRFIDLSDNYVGFAVKANCEIIATKLADYIASDNSYFSKQEFIKSCGITD